MTILRYYLMSAKDKSVEALRDALLALGERVALLPGCEGVEVAQETESVTRFHFIEQWASIEAHQD